MNTQVAVIEPEASTPISLEELAEFKTLEDRLHEAKRTVEASFKEVGEALNGICEKKLYRGEFKTFEAYVRGRWEMSPSRAYQIIDARKTWNLMLVHNVEISSEAVAREASGLSEKEKEEVAKGLAALRKNRPSRADMKKAAIKASPKKADAERKRAEKEEAKAAKIIAQADKKRLANEQKQAKVNSKETAKAIAASLQRAPRGGLAAMKAEMEAKQANGETQKPSAPEHGGVAIQTKIRKWWESNKAKLVKNSKDEIVKKIIALFE